MISSSNRTFWHFCGTLFCQNFKNALKLGHFSITVGFWLKKMISSSPTLPLGSDIWVLIRYLSGLLNMSDLGLEVTFLTLKHVFGENCELLRQNRSEFLMFEWKLWPKCIFCTPKIKKIPSWRAIKYSYLSIFF